MALVDKLTKNCLLHIRIKGRIEDNGNNNNYDFHEESSFAAAAPTNSNKRDADFGSDSNSDGDKDNDTLLSRRRKSGASTGATLEVLTFDVNDLALNPHESLSFDEKLNRTSDESSDPEGNGYMGASGVDNNIRSRLRVESESNIDVICMFRTETDEKLANKIEEAMALEQKERNLAERRVVFGKPKVGAVCCPVLTRKNLTPQIEGLKMPV